MTIAPALTHRVRDVLNARWRVIACRDHGGKIDDAALQILRELPDRIQRPPTQQRDIVGLKGNPV